MSHDAPSLEIDDLRDVLTDREIAYTRDRAPAAASRANSCHLRNGNMLKMALKRSRALRLGTFLVMNRSLDVYSNLIEMLRPEVDMDNSDFCGKAQ